MDFAGVATDLLAEARDANERRLLVLSGGRAATAEAVRSVVEAVDVDREATTLVSDRDLLPCERLAQDHADRLLGTTREAVVLDAHDECRPNALGRVVGAVDGGGLLLVLAPPLDRWPDRRDAFDETLVVDPYDLDDVTGHFRERLVATLRAHPGVAVVDVDEELVESDGLTHPAPRLASASSEPELPADPGFPGAVYDACLTADQVDAVAAFESLRAAELDEDAAAELDGDAAAVVLEADRGRGKSSAAGLAAAGLALDGDDVLVTAPAFRSAREVFVRARAVLAGMGRLGRVIDSGDDGTGEGAPRAIAARDGGRIRFRPPGEAVDRAGDADVVIVDEAAALPVRRLQDCLAADRVAFATTVHGYEGAGRGFSVRFRDRLAESRHAVVDVAMTQPIRYAAGDPVESWAFRALMLDARPPVDPLVADATTDSVAYRWIDSGELVDDENLLRETFGLLVLAHYRTEPDDLARLLDAPNVSVRALTHEGHVVSVALLAREGGLSAERRAEMYEGARIRGHMLPDVLTNQLRDESAGVPEGVRVMRIATHHAVRANGLGSLLLDRIREEAADRGLDWVGVGYGATPELVRFWRTSGYRAVHCSTTRNERSGEHSVLMLDPLSEAGQRLCDRHARWFVDRVGGLLTDSLRDVDADVVRETLRSARIAPDPNPGLSAHEWRVVAGSAYGPGTFKSDPAPFRRLVVCALADPDAAGDLSPRQERLLVRVICQAHAPPDVADDLDFHSVSNCLRALGDALAPLVNRYGGEVAREEKSRFDGA